MDKENLVQISGTVEDITYCNPENGFTVLELDTGEELITAVGVMTGASVGETLNLMGRWDIHRSYGRQFTVSYFERKVPATENAILRYLASGAIKGVGAATAARIVDRFGADTLDIIEKEPSRLAEIKGISPAKAEKISQAYAEQFGAREIMLRLSPYGITADEALRAFKRLGATACDDIEKNPYLLCTDGIGFSFERADDIAAEIGGVDVTARNCAGVLHVLRHNTGNGHTCLPYKKLTQTASVMLESGSDDIEIAIDILISDKQLVLEKINNEEYVFLPYLYRAERYIASRLLLALDFAVDTFPTIDSDIKKAEEHSGIEYAQKQRVAIKSALQSGVLVLTGGPGTGKTTTLNAIIELLEKYGQSVCLAAPTGRAAKRMNELCGREAKTIHRLLEAEFLENGSQAFCRNERNPLECDAIIIDELSMVDAFIMENLLRALPLSCRIIMVGDSDQLPSVGAGRVLYDIVESGRLCVVKLTEVFRQAQQSLIVTNAHKIVSGEMPEMSVRDNDFFLLSTQNPYSAEKTVGDLYCTRLPQSYGFDPTVDIQILCPSRKQILGTVNLNRVLQERINPPARGKREINQFGFTLREGDKVMQMKNNYDVVYTSDSGETGSGVFNGDIGVLKKIDTAGGVLTVEFDDHTALYTLEDAKNLELAYAATVHKSQGSEYECVILPIINPIPQLCYRNLLYTAVTRAKKILIIVGDARSVEAMVRNDKKTLRYTGLKYFLETGSIV